LRALIAVPTLILFFAASTFGNFVVSYCVPSGYDVEEPASEPVLEPAKVIPLEDCQPISCCPPRPDVPIEKPEPPPDKAHCVLPIFLAIDPSMIPCCAVVCAVEELSDFREKQRVPENSPDLISLANKVVFADHLEKEVLPYLSRPQGVHQCISTTILLL
jgi:hypothetical protein